jgi:hypothetical protein
MKYVVTIALILAVIRIWLGFTVEPDTFAWTQVYKDVAHLFMGGLFMSWWHDRTTRDISQFHILPEFRHEPWLTITWWDCQPWQWRLFWWLIVLEVIVATASRL